MIEKKIYTVESSLHPNLIKIEEITIYFMVFSNNKSVENLINILNKFIFNDKIKKMDQKFNKMIFFCVSVPLKNYLILKEALNFKMKKESLKFEFIYVKYKKNNLSVDFFERNFLEKVYRENYFEEIFYLNYLNILKNKIFFKKIILILIYFYIKVINNFKAIILKKV